MRKTNNAGVDLIKSFEGLRLNAYQDSVGVWTIGYGSTKGVKRGQRVTEEEAEELLREDLATAEAGVDGAITEEITDNQFAACVSLAFNVGTAAFKKSSIVKYINAGDVLPAADRFLLYNKAGGKVLTGLTRRRKAERALFLTDDEPEALILNGKIEPAPVSPEPPRQNVESGGAATQVVVGDTPKPAVSKADEDPVQASTGGKKTLWATVTGAVTAIPTAIWGALTGNSEVIKWALIVGGALGALFILRMIITDVVRMWTRADPQKYNVK